MEDECVVDFALSVLFMLRSASSDPINVGLFALLIQELTVKHTFLL